MARLMRVLVVNAGSSTLKVRALAGDDEVVADAVTDPWDGEDAGPIGEVAEKAGRPDVVAHRVVHGGRELRRATLLDESVVARIEALAPLAPLHQPRAVAAIRESWRVLPHVPAVACFDTTYHADLPPEAATYPIPEEWRSRWDLRRFGFHGLSHAHAARRAAELLGREARGTRVVTCHLGAGASLCATRGGRSVDTTMGFTPLDGIAMKTRAGAVDPGILLWLLEEGGLSPSALGKGLREQSGLAGLAGGSGDVRDVLARRTAGDERARLAFDVYVHRLVQGIAAMAASLRGLDALAFTGGVGEHQPLVRAAAVAPLSFLGLALDEAANAAAVGTDADVSAAGSGAATLVIATREDLEIARQARAVLAGAR